MAMHLIRRHRPSLIGFAALSAMFWLTIHRSGITATMPTIMTHALVGVAGAAAGRMIAGQPLPRNVWRVCLLLPIVPDVDVLAFRFGIPYGDLFGHRGIVHSIAFAALIAAAATILIRPHTSRRPWLGAGLLWCGLFALTAGHGLLDALTNGGMGIALLAPLDNTRYFFPVTPIEVAPIGLWHFFSRQGMNAILSEMLWVWLPLAVLVAGVWLCMTRIHRGADHER